MRDLWKKAMSVFLAAALVITLAVPSVTALAAAAAPDSVTGCTQDSLYGSNRDLVYLKLEFQDSNWIDAITGVSAGEESYSQQTSEFMMSIQSDPAWYAADKQLQIVWNAKNHSELTVSANGYEDTILLLSKTEDGYSVSVKKDSTESGSNGGSSGEGEEKTYQIQVAEAENGKVRVEETSGIKAGSTVAVITEPESGYVTKAVTVTGDTDSAAVSVTKAQDNSYTFSMPEENVTVTAVFEAYQKGTVSLSGVRLEAASYGNDWQLIFDQPQNYVAAVTGVKVNDTPWNEVSYTPSSGGSYKKNSSDNTLSFAQKDYSGNGTVLKSGDVVMITADGYEDFSFKLVIDKNGKAMLTENDGQGDPYELHVKIDGTFEAAIVGQKDYDGVSSASVGGSSSNKNSAVKVYGALVEKGGKLTLSDSAVQGIIEVKDGGTFSMNYDSYSGEFTTGASICGQLRLEDGATIENAAIYSHTNYLANGSLKDRSNSEPVVVATGNVTVKGQVFIKGDSAGTEIGQTALRVKDGHTDAGRRSSSRSLWRRRKNAPLPGGWNRRRA